MLFSKKDNCFSNKKCWNYIFNRINLYINKGNLFYINIDEPINNGYLTKNQILKQIKLKEKKIIY